MPADPVSTTVALADTRWVGHHPTYFREFIASLRRIGASVIALCPHPDELAPQPRLTTGLLQAPHGSLFSDRLDNDPATTIHRWWRTRRALEDAEARGGLRADLVFFPYLDSYLRFLPVAAAPGRLLGRPWSGLYFRNQHLARRPHGAVEGLRHQIKGDRLLRSPTALPFIGVLDERFNAEFAARTGRTALPFPDITDETPPDAPTAVSAALRAQARGRPIIGLAGSLEKRKGLLTLLRIAEACRQDEPWYFAAVGPFAAGTFSVDELAWIERTRSLLAGSLHLDLTGDRLPDGAPYNAVFQAFDIAWAAYEDFQGSSNTLTKAALFETPVIATEGECVSARVRQFNLGESIPAGDVEAGREVIRRLLAARETGVPVRQFAEYRRRHSRAQLDETFRRLVASLPAAGS